MVDKVLKKPQWLKVSSVGAMTSFDPPNLRLINDYLKWSLIGIPPNSLGF